MMFRSVMLVLLLLIPLLRSAESAHLMRACGQPLMELLSMACRNGYNSLFSKRGSLGLFDYEDHLTDLDSSEAHHMNSLSGIRRDWRGIVDDCCHKPCTKDKLTSYCRL